MVKLRLLDLRCIEHQEIGSDEPYLLVDGERVWSVDNMKRSMSYSLRGVPPIGFEDRIEITLMEKDPIRDDCLGTGTASAEQLGRGEQELEFADDGGRYQLIYEIIAD